MSQISAHPAQPHETSQLRTAIRLLAALERVPTAVPSLGELVIPKALQVDTDEEMGEEEEEQEGVAHEEEEDSAEANSDSANSDSPRQRAEKLHAVLSDACLGALDAPAVLASGSGKVLEMPRHDPNVLYRYNYSHREGGDKKAPPLPALPDPSLLELRLEATGDSGSTGAGAGPTSAAEAPVSYSGSLRELPPSLLEQLWQCAPLSPFGHVASQDTRIDARVRHARELSVASGQVRVQPLLLERLAALWSEHMLPRAVRVEAYKLNVYGPGGHFAPHRDTPAPGLVGTILVGLADTADEASGLRVWTNQHNVIEGAEEDVMVVPAASALAAAAASGSGSSTDESAVGGASVVWRSRAGSILLFYPDVTHAVLPVKSGLRATLAFKVFAEAKAPSARSEEQTLAHSTQAELRARMMRTLRRCPTPFGLLLNHYYTQEASVEQLRGNDALLYSLLQEVGDLQLSVIPVLLRVSETGPDYDTAGRKTPNGIFPVTEAVIELACATAKQYEEVPDEQLPSVAGVRWDESLPFFPLSNFLDASKRLSCTLLVHGGEGGNESRPSEAESIYLHRAIIVRRAADDAAGAVASLPVS